MVSRGGGSSFSDDRVTRLWYVRRAVTVAALLAIILSMVGTFAYKVYKDSEEKHVAFLESMVSHYRGDAGPELYGKEFKPVPNNFVKNRDAGAWFTDPVNPRREKNLSALIRAYNQQNPAKKTTVKEIREYYGRDWQKHVRENFSGRANASEFTYWCKQKADLVYRVDCFDPLDGKYHKAGEAVVLNSSIQPSNYSYAVSAYTFYELKSDFEVGR
ncbi:hypothetical protein [Scardovia wiggsiae]|uniref:hypothetical protein n=2 Tax=Scardovia wiggsiae TaxID=230143 RepID=UPI00374F1D86